MKVMFCPINQFKEAHADTKEKFKKIMKHNQERGQVAVAFLNENLKRAHENDILLIQENPELGTFRSK